MAEHTSEDLKAPSINKIEQQMKELDKAVAVKLDELEEKINRLKKVFLEHYHFENDVAVPGKLVPF